MTKEELTRIKQAYNSGLKVQIWFDGYWENFDARDYSMYSDPFSENRQYRIVGSAYADIAEKRIAELEKEISVLLSCQNCPDNKGGLLCQKEYEDKCLAQKIQYIKELLEENAELKEKLNFSTQYYRGEKAREQLTKAKEIILKLYNAGRDVLMCRAEEKAYTRLDNAINDKRIEQFLKEVSE